MSNNQYYEDVKVLKKPFKKQFKEFLKIVALVAVVLFSVLIARFLSTAITVGSLGAYIIYGDTNLKIEKPTMYAVILGEYDNEEEAERIGLGASIQGAGGYVWRGEKYWVVGSVYTELADAQKVKENLKDSKYTIDIKEIMFPSLQLDFGMYENSDMGKIKSAFQIFDDIYQILYDNSILYDKGEISHLSISNKLSSERGVVKSYIVSMQNLINKSSSQLPILQRYLISLDELLDNTIIKTIDNTATNYALKYSLTSCVRLKYDLFQSLK